MRDQLKTTLQFTAFFKRIFLICFVSVSYFSHAQQQFIRFGTTVLSTGISGGIQPNYRLGAGSTFLFGSLDQQITVKGLPFQFTGRLSNEPYLSGRASYFRLSYQGRSYQRTNLDSLQLKIGRLEAEKLKKLEAIYALEGKLSYLKYLDTEYPKSDSLPLPQLPGLDSLLPGFSFPGTDVNLEQPEVSQPSIPSTPSISMPSIPDTANLSELDRLLALADFALKVKNLEVQSLDQSIQLLKKSYADLSLQKYTSLLNGITKFDVGLCGLSGSHLSSNALPIQGIRIRGKYGKWTYGLAAGLTIPNKVYSNLALDQVLNNTANVFNYSNFYQVNTVRLASAVSAEYGDAGRNSVFIEDFYTGASYEKFKRVSSSGISNATNIGAYVTPKFAKNLTLSGTLGFSVNNEDTTDYPVSDQLATSGQLQYRFVRARGEFNTKFKNIGAGYNGFAQGIYISGVRHIESSYQQALFNRLVVKVTGSRDDFSNQDSIVRTSFINQGTLDLTCKVGKRSVVYSSGTLLQTDVTVSGQYSYQLRFGFHLEKQFKEVSWSNALESSYTRILGVDSNQVLSQISFKSGIQMEHWGYSLKGTLQEFSGLNRIYGRNIIIQPEIGYNYAMSVFSVSGQYLISEQFGEDFGFGLSWSFKPSEFFQWKVSAQRWLASETAFFLTNPDFSYSPYYGTIQMILTLKHK